MHNLASQVVTIAARNMARFSVRHGQALFTALTELDMPVADKIRNTDADPYYNDARIPAFWEKLYELTGEIHDSKV